MQKLKGSNNLMQKLVAIAFTVGSILFTVSNAASQQKDGAEAYREKEISFSNGDVKLAASLLTPKKTTVKVPGVVIVHGSGKSSRNNAWTTAFAKGLAERGIAVLYPDKRGSGKSQGDWTTSNFQDLAGDVLSAVETLRSQPLVDTTRIGIIGFSQGGMIVPIAASRSKHITLVASISGPTVPITEQVLDEVESGAIRAGVPKSQAGMVRNLVKLGIDSALWGKRTEEYLAALENAKKSPLGGKGMLERLPTNPNHPLMKFLKTVGDFDPMPYWKKTTVPSLFVFAGNDSQVRVEKSLRRIRKDLEAPDKNITTLFFGLNGHAFFRDDLADFIARWIKDRGAK